MCLCGEHYVEGHDERRQEEGKKISSKLRSLPGITHHFVLPYDETLTKNHKNSHAHTYTNSPPFLDAPHHQVGPPSVSSSSTQFLLPPLSPLLPPPPEPHQTSHRVVSQRGRRYSRHLSRIHFSTLTHTRTSTSTITTNDGQRRRETLWRRSQEDLEQTSLMY